MMDITEIQIGEDKRRIKDDKAIYSEELNTTLQEYAKKSEIPDVSGLATKEEIPNVDSFITNTVDNLVNYYKKSETYTQEEINTRLGQITTINFKVVESLPDTGESNLIYLVKRVTKATTDDLYDEYIWIAEDSKYEIIGSTAVDLSNYYNKSEADSKFALKIDIADMLTKTEAAQKYATKSELGNKLDASVYNSEKASFATKTELAAKADKVSVEDVVETTKELQPNKYYVFGEVETLTLTFAEGKSDQLNEYMFEFTSGTTPTTLTLPEIVKWMGDNTIEASKTYQVSIVNNIAVMGGA